MARTCLCGALAAGAAACTRAPDPATTPSPAHSSSLTPGSLPSSASVPAPRGPGPLLAARLDLGKAFRGASDEATRARIRARARELLVQSLVDDVLPQWDGTPWAFHGTSTVPGQGTIACGYFVSTTLREAGLDVERVRLAQQASEKIVRTLVPAAKIRRFSDAPVLAFVTAVAQQGDGLYVVGLDDHVGYLVVQGGVVWFHHASYVGAKVVVREPAVLAKPLVKSRYRVVGKLFTDDRLVEAWLLGAAVPTAT